MGALTAPTMANSSTAAALFKDALVSHTAPRCERRAAENLPNMEIYFGERRGCSFFLLVVEGRAEAGEPAPPRRMRNGPCRAEPRMEAGKALRGRT